MSFANLNDQKEIEPLPGFHARFVHSDHMTLAFWHIDAGAKLPEHAHAHEQITHIVNGEFEFTLEGKTQTIRAGSVVVIPSNAKHSAQALTNCQAIDAFYPVREDYKKL